MPGYSSGVSDVTVNKQELMNIIQKNRDNHRAIFDQAVEAFTRQAEKNLTDMIIAIKSGNVRAYGLRPLVIPEEHTADYDRALRMYSMHQGDSVSLSEEACQRLVDDDWGWAASFASNTSSYVSKGLL